MSQVFITHVWVVYHHCPDGQKEPVFYKWRFELGVQPVAGMRYQVDGHSFGQDLDLLLRFDEVRLNCENEFIAICRVPQVAVKTDLGKVLESYGFVRMDEHEGRRAFYSVQEIG